MANDRSSLFGSKTKSYGSAINNDDQQKALKRELEWLKAIKVLAEAGNFKDAIAYSTSDKSRMKDHGKKMQEMFQSLTKSAEQFENNSVMMKGINRHLGELKGSFITRLENAIIETIEDLTKLSVKNQPK